MIKQLKSIYYLGYNTGKLTLHLVRKGLSQLEWVCLIFCGVLGNILVALTQFSLERVPSAEERQVLAAQRTNTTTTVTQSPGWSPVTILSTEWGTARPITSPSTTATIFFREQEVEQKWDCVRTPDSRKTSKAAREEQGW